MTFSYDLSAGFNDTSRVRFYIGDTDENAARLQDEEIDALLTEFGDYQHASIAGIKYILRKLSEPNFRADWLQVDNKSAREGYAARLKELQQQFGISSVVTGATHVYRKDSYQTEEPTYDVALGDETDWWWLR